MYHPVTCLESSWSCQDQQSTYLGEQRNGGICKGTGGGTSIGHPGITFDQAGLFRRDGIHLSDTGNDIVVISRRDWRGVWCGGSRITPGGLVHRERMKTNTAVSSVAEQRGTLQVCVHLNSAIFYEKQPGKRPRSTRYVNPEAWGGLLECAQVFGFFFEEHEVAAECSIFCFVVHLLIWENRLLILISQNDLFKNKTWMKEAASKNAAPWRAWLEALQFQYRGARGAAFGKPVCFWPFLLSFVFSLFSEQHLVMHKQEDIRTQTTAKASVF